MARRLYFSLSNNTSGLTPSFNASWGYNSEAVRRDLEIVKGSETLTVGTTIGAWTAGQNALDRQYISPPLKAQSLSGTFKGQLMVREYANTDNVTQIRVGIYVVNSSGTVVATLYTLANASGTTNEFVNNATHRNEHIATGQSLSSYSCADNDRLVVEIGYTDASGTTPEASAKWGNTADTDLPENETQTSNGCPWIEFSSDFTFLRTGDGSSAGVAEGLASGAGVQTLSGDGSAAGAATVAATGAAIVIEARDGASVAVAAVLGVGVALVRLRPSADITDGSWTNASGNNTDLYASIDEASASDADYIQSATSPNADVCVVQIASGTDPSTGANHSVSYRYLKSATADEVIDLTVTLLSGATEIASWTHENIGTTATTVTQTLTEGQADSITNYADLRLRFSASHI